MTTDADEETIDAIETFGLAGADADAIARGGCEISGEDSRRPLDRGENRNRTERLTDDARAHARALLAPQRSPACDRSV